MGQALKIGRRKRVNNSDNKIKSRKMIKKNNEILKKLKEENERLILKVKD